MRKPSLKNKPAVKITITLSTRHLVAGGIALVILLFIGTFVFLNLGNSQSTHAAPPAVTPRKLIATNGGNWSATSPYIWYYTNGTLANRLPVDGDTIEIPATKTVNVTSNVSTFTSTSREIVNIKGTLNFANTVDMNLGSMSIVNIPTNGNITGGNGSTRLYVGNTIIYKGNQGIIGAVAPTNCGSLGCGTTILPIELVYFKAKMEEERAGLEWSTATEVNNAYFTIEKSSDAKTFIAIIKIPGAGNSREIKKYSYTDNAPLAGTAYYRLKQTDHDGTSVYSKVISLTNTRSTLENASSMAVTGVGPNPFEQSFFVDFDLASEGPVAIQLTNMQGKVFEATTIDGSIGNNRYEFNDTQGLPAGSYLFSIKQSKTSSKVIRLVKRS